jgi:hypothetical protein
MVTTTRLVGGLPEGGVEPGHGAPAAHAFPVPSRRIRRDETHDDGFFPGMAQLLRIVHKRRTPPPGAP